MKDTARKIAEDALKQFARWFFKEYGGGIPNEIAGEPSDEFV